MGRKSSNWIRRKADGNLTGGGAVTRIEIVRRSQGDLSSVQLRWDATLVTSAIALETCNLPEDVVTATSTAVGDWKTESSVTIANAAGTLGGDLVHLGNNGALRIRLAITTTTAGSLDIVAVEKEG